MCFNNSRIWGENLAGQCIYKSPMTVVVRSNVVFPLLLHVDFMEQFDLGL